MFIARTRSHWFIILKCSSLSGGTSYYCILDPTNVVKNDMKGNLVVFLKDSVVGISRLDMFLEIYLAGKYNGHINKHSSKRHSKFVCNI